MMIIGCDFHPSWPQVSWLDTETGEVGEQKLVHASGDAKRFYEQLAEPVLVGMEATGNSQWFIELVEDLGHAIWTVRVRFPESWSSTSLATQRCPTHRQEIFVLDNAFALI